MPTVLEQPNGTWRIFFFRHIDGIVVYTNKALAMILTRDGQAIDIIGRRRPLLGQSQYPLRSPEEAWDLLTKGRGSTMYVDDGAAPLKGTVDRFVAREVELAYIEAEVTQEEQIMQPYYAFRNEARQTLYVPAVADPHLEWAEMGQ